MDFLIKCHSHTQSCSKTISEICKLTYGKGTHKTINLNSFYTIHKFTHLKNCTYMHGRKYSYVPVKSTISLSSMTALGLAENKDILFVPVGNEYKINNYVYSGASSIHIPNNKKCKTAIN